MEARSSDTQSVLTVRHPRDSPIGRCRSDTDSDMPRSGLDPCPLGCLASGRAARVHPLGVDLPCSAGQARRDIFCGRVLLYFVKVVTGEEVTLPPERFIRIQRRMVIPISSDLYVLGHGCVARTLYCATAG
jgi:hypothetical protein